MDSIHRYADLLVPDRLGFVVTGVDGDPDTVAVEAQTLRDQLPTPGYGGLLEVIAEREVSEHLEENEVAFGSTDVVEVVVLPAGSRALLHRRRPGIGCHLIADEIRLEGDHPGDREQNRGIVRDEARGLHCGVLPLGEETGERATEFVRRRRRRSRS